MAGLRDLTVVAGRRLPARLLSVRFAGAGGPGGQHVNRTATKVDLRLDLDGAREFLGERAVRQIRSRLASRLDAQGNLQVVCSEYREQGRNVEAALSRMEHLLNQALRRRKPRRPTKPSAGARERRLAEKKLRGQLKRWRAKVDDGL